VTGGNPIGEMREFGEITDRSDAREIKTDIPRDLLYEVGDLSDLVQSSQGLTSADAIGPFLLLSPLIGTGR